MADDPLLALPGIRVGRAGHGEVPRPAAARPRRRGAARGQRGRPGDPRARPPGGRAGRRTWPDASMPGCRRRCCAAGRRKRQRRRAWTAATARCWRWPPTRPSTRRLFNSGVSQAQWAAWTRNRRTPLINKATAGAVCAGLDLQDGGGAGRRWRRKAITPGRPGVLPRLSRPRRHALPLLAQGRARHARPARRPQAQLRRLFLRGRPAHRHRPHRRDGQPARAWASTSRSTCPARAAGLIPTRAWRHGARASLEHRRHHRQRHRPGLHPGHAAAARHLCRRASPPAARCSRT